MRARKFIALICLIMLATTIRVESQISRSQVVANAAGYTTYTWNCNANNLSAAGYYCSGAGRTVYAATCWVVVGSNISMPYCWGGWSTQVQHTAVMTTLTNTQAGDVCSANCGGGCSGGFAGFTCSSGHDCSGLVSRAWGLSSKYSTSTLPNISTPTTLTTTQQGDILNRAGSHVRLVETNYGNGNYRVIEASGSDWKCAYHTYTAVNLSGYDPRCPNPSYVTGTCGVTCTIPAEPSQTSMNGPDQVHAVVSYSLTPALTWTDVGADCYYVYIRNVDSNLLLPLQGPVYSTSYTVPSGLLADRTNYRWNLKADADCDTVCQSSIPAAVYFYTCNCPLAPDSIYGNSAVNEGVEYNFSVSPVDCATDYMWTLPAGWNILSGQGTMIINVVAGSTAGDICVAPSNSYCQGIAKCIQVSNPTGISQISPLPGISIYPNPSKNNLTLEYDLPGRTLFSSQLYDITGRMVCIISEPKELEGHGRISVTTGHLAPGEYFIRIFKGNETFHSKIILLR